MNNLSLMIAWRYLRAKRKESSMALMLKICFLGITIGSFALMLTLIITNGFEKTITEKMQGINAEVIISAPGKQLHAESIRQMLFDNFPHLISAASGQSIRNVIVERGKKRSLMFIKGVEPAHEGTVTSIEQKMMKAAIPTIPSAEKQLRPSGSLNELLGENRIIIGYKAAETFDLKIGDALTILIPEPTGKRKIGLTKKKAIISGIFKIGLDEYDSGFAFSSLPFLYDLFDEEAKGVDQLAIKLDKSVHKFRWKKLLTWEYYRDFFRGVSPEEQAADILQKQLPALRIQSWRDLYPALVSSLKLEKYVMFFIIALISLVASMSMISLLFIQIQQKRGNIAIFRAMGMPINRIRSIFLAIGLTVTFLGSVTGLALAGMVGYFLERYPFIELPDVYYVTHLPAHLEPEIFLVVFLCTVFLGFLASWIPSQQARKINITEVLRSE